MPGKYTGTQRAESAAIVQHKVELLAPAGNWEKLEIAVHYGADAVYLAGRQFSLRNFSTNFDPEQLARAITYCHSRKVKVYVAVNIFARNADISALIDYLVLLSDLRPDGIIVADPALVALAGRHAPGLALHLSTQANTTNIEAVRFWKTLGVKRFNLARELNLAEIEAFAGEEGVQIEVFVHGAMCISYSGRCLLSNFMAQRPSNQGMCCQPCRFSYAVVEQKRPGHYFPIAQDPRGSYIFNSRDLCLLPYLPEVIQAGVHALKIEGRMKSIHYTATAVKTYREAIDSYYKDPGRYRPEPYWQMELNKITSRGYCSGFLFGDTDQTAPQYAAPRPSDYPLIGKVLEPAIHGRARIEARNRLEVGQPIEIVHAIGPPECAMLKGLQDGEGRELRAANPGNHVWADLGTDCQAMDLLRRRPSE
jgi:putative protease